MNEQLERLIELQQKQAELLEKIDWKLWRLYQHLGLEVKTDTAQPQSKALPSARPDRRKHD
jgi:hypothetical protein